MFGWKKKYKVLKEKFDLLKDDYDVYKMNVKNKEEHYKKISDENEKLIKGYTSLVKLYGVKHSSFKFPYTLNLYDKYSSSVYSEPNLVELNIPQIRIVADRSLFDSVGIDVDGV